MIFLNTYSTTYRDSKGHNISLDIYGWVIGTDFSTLNSRYNKLARQATFVCYIK